jgi:preprotein translocase subunit SecG
MKFYWKKVLVKTTIWLAAEIMLNLLGLDNIADYSEFIYGQEAMLLNSLHQPAIVVPGA